MRHGRSRRSLLRGVSAVSVVGVAGCLGTRGQKTQSPAGDASVRITADHAFDPARITVAPGETVVWTNGAYRMHSVTADEDRIPSVREYFASGGFQREIAARVAYPLKGGLARGERYAHTFRKSGTYGYFSIPFESEEMEGTVVVAER